VGRNVEAQRPGAELEALLSWAGGRLGSEDLGLGRALRPKASLVDLFIDSTMV
jgi:hypothetical protein